MVNYNKIVNDIVGTNNSSVYSCAINKSVQVQHKSTTSSIIYSNRSE